jgi:hypothetical protein
MAVESEQKHRADMSNKSNLIVTVRTYSDIMDAQLARTHLQSHGIAAYLPDEQMTTVYPLSAPALGGIRLQVSCENEVLAIELLDKYQTADDNELINYESNELRCPFCGSEYCYLRETVVRTILRPFLRGSSWQPSGKKRWYCRRCESKWEGEPNQWPTFVSKKSDSVHSPSKLPVFRLRRTRAFGGMALGLVGGLAIALIFQPEMWWLFSIPAALGFLFGKSAFFDVCSQPTCRTLLSPDSEKCPKCKRAIGGVIYRTQDHFIEQHSRR